MRELRFGDIRFTVEVSRRILALEADLFGFGTVPGQRSRLGRATVNLAYTPVVMVHRVSPSFPLTSLQVYAVEEARAGDVQFEIDLNATLPQAAGYPGCAQDTADQHRERRWEEQIAQLWPSAAFEMAVQYPLGDCSGPRSARLCGTRSAC